MDNADLERLTIFPGKFRPVFHPNITEYSVSLGSDVKQLKIDPLTSDCGASYSVSGAAGKIVNLLEGEITSIKIEVTAEDGSTIKNYFIHASRLSAKEAVLNDLHCSVGNLSPSFAPNIQNYSLSVPFSLSFIEITASAADSKAVLKLNGKEDLKVPIQLNFGETQVEIEVISPDRSTSKLYTVKVCKQHLLRCASFINKPSFTKAECPVCLGIPHRPKSIAGSHSGHVYCKSCIDELTRTSKQDPLDDSPLQGEWRLDEFELDKELSSLPTYCVFKQWGCTEKPLLYDLGNHIIHCEYRPVIVDKSSELVSAKDLNTKSKDSTTACSDCNRPVRTNEMKWHKIYMCTSKKNNTAVMHKVDVRTWEKKIQQETSEKTAEMLIFTAEGVEEDYLKAIPKHGYAGQFTGDVTPPQLLNSAAELYATAIKLAPKDARLHFCLAQIYEEIYYCQDLYGLKHQTASEVDLDFNLKSKESSKEDDIQALCEMRGVGRNASLSLQLKAIDEEYHYLLEQGRSDKAEYVQQLYAFKSKQTLKDEKAGKLAVNEEEPLGKAYLKYMDALVCDVDNYLYSLYVGKMLVFQGKYDEAVSILQVATGLKPTNTESRFYLGLALAQQTSGVGDRKEEAIKYLSEGIEYLLNHAREEDENCELVASRPIKLFNIHCLQAFLILADLVRDTRSLPIGVMSAVDAYHSAAIVSTRVLSSLVSRGDTYHAVEWTLFQAHSSLLQFALEAEKENKPIIDQTLVTSRCDNLSALIKSSTIPLGKQLLSLQEKTCQQAVLLQPSNSRSIYLLGDAQLRCYDSDLAASGSKDRLQECEDSYRVSIELEGKPSGEKTIPGKICQQNWYKEHQTKLQSEKKAENTPQKTATASKTGGMSGKATLPVRGGGVSARGRGATSNVGRGSPCTREGASTRPSAARGRASPAKNVSMQSRTKQPSSVATSSVSPTKTRSAHKSGSCARTNSHSQPPKIPDKHLAKEAEILVGPLNKPAYQPRLGLARVLVRKGASMEEIRKLYEEVISLAPEFHDAYIELADCLIKTNPMKAVDVYSKYPFKENQSFDDAYIHGEIVRIIMKQEKYDDLRLGPSLISLGKTMGLTVIEKYVETLDKTFKYSKLLCQVYASVHGKDVDDPDLQQFFKFKCWI